MDNINKLEHLIAFHKYGTLSKASENLHISQPSLSRSMQALEEELQVPLFNRYKNKLTLNENGKLAVEYAIKVIDQLNDMKSKVRNFDKMNKTINIGSCGPMPTLTLIHMLSNNYPEMTISNETKGITKLIDGLKNDVYQIIILPYEPKTDETLVYKAIGEEHLMFSLPKNHRLAKEKSLYLSDIDGENMIVMPNLGFWRDIIDEKMPNSRFLEQTDRFSFEELVQSSVLPSFASTLSISDNYPPSDRVNIPILDPEVNVTFYAVTKRINLNKYKNIFR